MEINQDKVPSTISEAVDDVVASLSEEDLRDIRAG